MGGCRRRARRARSSGSGSGPNSGTPTSTTAWGGGGRGGRGSGCNRGDSRRHRLGVPRSSCWPGGRSDSGAGLVIDGRSGNDICVELLVDVDEDARVSGTVCAGNFDCGGAGSAASTYV